MEVVIRLQRAGKKANKRYNYRVVAMNKSSNRQGRHLELLGYYDPAQKDSFSISLEKLDQWINKGARMSDTVRSLVSRSKKK